MSSQKFIVTTLVGFVTLFVVGYAIYGIVLAQFFAGQVGSATGVMKEPPAIWAIALGNVALAALLTIVFGQWARLSGAGPGFQAGAVFGFLVATGFDFIIYGTTNMSTLTGLIVDIVVSTGLYGITGAVIGVMLARK